MLVLDEADEMLNKGTSHRSRISPDLELLTRSHGRGETWSECKHFWCLREACAPGAATEVNLHFALTGDRWGA